MKLFFFLSLFIIATSQVFSQEIREESSLNYTYIGPVFSASSNSGEYSDWIDNQYQTKKVSGTSYMGGLDLKIVAGNVCGDFQSKYSYSSYDTTLTCLEFILAGEYIYNFNEIIGMGAGLGLYMETPPSSKDHNGSSGFYFPITAMFNTTSNTKLFLEFFAKYGTYAIGNDTKFTSYGCNIGFVFKVGRI
jgi:hypothetical protein